MDREKLDQSLPTEEAGPATKLNDELIRQFMSFVKRGLPLDGVCDLLSVWPSTFWSWKRKGEQHIAGGTDAPKKGEIYGRFVLALRRALAEYRLERLDKLHSSEDKNWVKEMAILERRDRHSFSRREPQGGSDASYDPDERFL